MQPAPSFLSTQTALSTASALNTPATSSPFQHSSHPPPPPTPLQHLCRGANNIDDHFRNMPLENNLPVLMGLISVWNISFLQYPALAILPYCQVCEGGQREG